MVNYRMRFNINVFIHICVKIYHIHPCLPLNKTFINSVKMGVVKRLLSMRNPCVRVSCAKSTAIYGIILKDVANFVV